MDGHEWRLGRNHWTVRHGASDRMAGMIEMPPPPEPPELEPDKIRALIDYADRMAGVHGG